MHILTEFQQEALSHVVALLSEVQSINPDINPQFPVRIEQDTNDYVEDDSGVSVYVDIKYRNRKILAVFTFDGFRVGITLTDKQDRGKAQNYNHDDIIWSLLKTETSGHTMTADVTLEQLTAKSFSMAIDTVAKTGGLTVSDIEDLRESLYGTRYGYTTRRYGLRAVPYDDYDVLNSIFFKP